MMLSPFFRWPQTYAGRGLGWHPSPPKAANEKPDHTLDDGHIRLDTTAPPTADASRLVLSILDQGPIGSCTANAAAQAVRASQVKQILAMGMPLERIAASPPPLLSRLMLYWLARARWGESHQDSGTFIRTIFEQLNAFGFTPETDWPYVVNDLNEVNPRYTMRPPTRAFIDANDQRSPTKYVRITSTGDGRVEDIKRAIASDYLVEFGTPVTEMFCSSSFDPSRPIPKPSITDAIAGGHAMSIAKYDADGAYVPNSWGTSFGLGGWVHFSWDYIAWSRTDDIWIVEAAPMFAPDILQRIAA